MSDRKRKRFYVKVVFEPDKDYQYIETKSEEEAIEEFKERFEHDIIHHWLKYSAEEVEEDEE
jgi:hypothetical protein